MAATTDKITSTRNAGRPTTTTAVGTRTVGGTSLECSALTGWPTESKVHFVTYKVDSANVQVANTQQDCTAIVSGNFLTQLTVVDGVDIGNALGDVVEMLPTAAWAQDLADALTLEHDRTGKHGDITTGDITTTGTVNITGSLVLNGISVAAIMYPVGSLYLTTVSTNPATIFGFGTWEAHAKGQALVGKADSGTFSTGGATGGAETVTLTSAQSGMPAHSHGVYDPGHTHSTPDTYSTYGGARNRASLGAGGNVYWGSMLVNGSGTGISIYNSSAPDASSAHNNLQPYLVIYVWKRTA